jgi:hypothetical protein
MKRHACTHERSNFFLLGGGRKEGEWFFLKILVPNVLSMCSSSSKIVPQDIPNSTSDLSRMVCLKLNSRIYLNWKGGRWQSTFVFISQLRSKEVLLFWREPKVPKNWRHANQYNGPIPKKIEKKWKPSAHPWIWITLWILHAFHFTFSCDSGVPTSIHEQKKFKSKNSLSALCLVKALGCGLYWNQPPHLTPHCIGTYSGKGGFHDKPVVKYTILVKFVDKGFTLQ